jgi:hypothetical protein
MRMASEFADVVFDPVAAERACAAVDEALAALDALAENRARSATDVLCSCSGPYAVALQADVMGANREAESFAGELRALRARIRTAQDDAFAAQVRVAARRALAGEEAVRAEAAGLAAEAYLAGSGTAVGSTTTQPGG